jgi:hypothetical protein
MRATMVLGVKVLADRAAAVMVRWLFGFPSPHSRSEWRGGVRGGGLYRPNSQNTTDTATLISTHVTIGK